jgi:hypothetical protein
VSPTADIFGGHKHRRRIYAAEQPHREEYVMATRIATHNRDAEPGRETPGTGDTEPECRG